MTEKLVIAINGSTGSASALGWAIHRSATVDMELELVSVIELEPVRGWPNEQEILPAYERMLLAAAQRVAAEAPHVPTTTKVRRGAVRRELLAAAHGRDILVVGTREPTGYFSGTLRHHLASGADGIVAIIPAGWIPRGASIVVGLGSDDTSAPALAFAASEADRLSRTLDVVHCWLPPVSQILEWLSAGVDPMKYIEADHAAMLHASVTQITRDHPSVTINPILRRGNAAIELTDAAEHASAVVIGTHHHGLMASTMLGSVGHDLLLTMPSPIVIVPTGPSAQR